MMVNGTVLLNRSLNIKKHYLNLAVFFAVFWVWRLITFALMGANCGYDFSAIDAGGIINHFVLLQDFGAPLLVDHLWFIIVYIRIQIILPLLRYPFVAEEKDFAVCASVIMSFLWIACFAVKDYSLIAAALPSVLSSLVTDSLTSYSPFSGIYGSMIFFFLLGGILGRYADRLKKLHFSVYILFFAAASAVQTVVYVIEHISLGAGTDLVFGRYNTTTNIIMCVSVFIMAHKCEDIFEKYPSIFSVFELAGQNTISVFYLHWLIGKLIMPHLNLPDGYPVSVAAIAALVFLCTIISIAGKKVPVIKYLFGAKPTVENKNRKTSMI